MRCQSRAESGGHISFSERGRLPMLLLEHSRPRRWSAARQACSRGTAARPQPQPRLKQPRSSSHPLQTTARPRPATRATARHSLPWAPRQRSHRHAPSSGSALTTLALDIRAIRWTCTRRADAPATLAPRARHATHHRSGPPTADPRRLDENDDPQQEATAGDAPRPYALQSHARADRCVATVRVSTKPSAAAYTAPLHTAPRSAPARPSH